MEDHNAGRTQRAHLDGYARHWGRWGPSMRSRICISRRFETGNVSKTSVESGRGVSYGMA